MVDLYTALQLCGEDAYVIQINGSEYTPKQIREQFDMRKTKVYKIRFDLWNECLEFVTSK